MATLQQEITTAFLKKLEESDVVQADKVEQLRVLLNDDKKLKADEIVKILSPSAGEDLK